MDTLSETADKVDQSLQNMKMNKGGTMEHFKRTSVEITDIWQSSCLHLPDSVSR